jgi:ABC-2 type transport system permease protein/sodium transport system permease protein
MFWRALMSQPHSSRWARLGRLTRKELSEILRDRRTIVTLVAMPLLLYPLLSVAFLQFAWIGRTSGGEDITYTYGFANQREADLFLLRLRKGEANLDHESTGGATPTVNSHVIATHGERAAAQELEAALHAGLIDLVVHIPGVLEADLQHHLRPQRDWQFNCEMTYVAGSVNGLGALAFAERRLASADAADLAQRLNVPGVRPGSVLLRPTRVAVKGQEPDSIASLGSLVPLILILMTVTGAVYPAIDLTAGERERGTLEVLIAAPVPRFSLLTAKYLAVVAVAVMTAVVNLVSMTITLQVSGLGKQLFGGGLSFVAILELLALLLLFAAFFSAVLLSLTSFARSFKEAQAYLIPLMLGALGPGVLAMMPGLRLRAELAVLPLVNIVLLARDLFNGEADRLLAVVVVATTLLYALAALSLAARVFGAESVLYSEQSGWSDLLRRPEASSTTPSITSALWCLALAVPIHFLISSLVRPSVDSPAQLSATSLTISMTVGAVLSVLLFVGLPSIAAYLERVRWSPGFGLTFPRPAAILAGLVLGLSLWPLVLRFLQESTPVSAGHEVIVSTLRAAAGPLFLVMAVTAAITEELFFRGYLFRALRARSGPLVTIGVSAILFGIAHVFLGGALGLERLGPSTILGVVLGVVCWLSGSVVPGMVLHVCHNTTLVVLMLTGTTSRNDVPWTWIVAGTVGTLVGAALLVVGKQRQPAPLAG